MIKNKRNLSIKCLLMTIFILMFNMFSSFTNSTKVEAAPLKGEIPGVLEVFNPLDILRGIGDPIALEQVRFADYDLYDAKTAEKVSQELELTGRVVPVPKKYAIQQGKPLNQEPIGDKPRNSYWTIEGEYGFVPAFSSTTEISVFRKNGTTYKEEKIYEIDSSGETKLVNKAPEVAVFNKGEEGYVKFTNLGYYKGKPVTITMRPKNVSNQISIGLRKPDNKLTSNRYGMMSVSQSGYNSQEAEQGLDPYGDVGSLYNQYGSAYTDIEYNFYDSKLNDQWDFEPSKNNSSKMKVQGFYTYGDFDFEESIGISKDIKIHNLYVLQAGKDPNDPHEVLTELDLPIERIGTLEEALSFKDYKKNYFPDFSNDQTTYENDPLGIDEKVIAETINRVTGLNNKNPIQQYLFQYASENSDWMNQLSYSIDKDFRYFNRGARTNTAEYKIANWLSFTYEETESFTLRINVSALESFDPMGRKGMRDVASSPFDIEFKFDHEIWEPEQSEILYVGRNKLLYKIMDKQLEKSGKSDISEILEFQPLNYRSSFTYGPEHNGKVVIGYDPNGYPFGTAPPIGEDSDKFREKVLKKYYIGNYNKYKIQQVENSTEERILDFLFDVLTEVDSSKGPYSAYGYNTDNIGHIYSRNSIKAAKEAGYNKANEGAALLNVYRNYESAQDSGKGFPTTIDFMRYMNPPINLIQEPYTKASDKGQSVDPFGSNVYFTSDTILPISFPAPIKEVKSDDEIRINSGDKPDNKIVWRILQDVPPRVVENAEPMYVFEDTIDKGLKIDKVTIKDLKTNTDETVRWKDERNGNKIKLTPLDLNKDYFYSRSFEIIITTSVDENVFNNMSEADLKNNYNITKDNYLEVKNLGTVEMAPRSGDTDNLILYTRPDYSIPNTDKKATIGKLKLNGDLDITKIAEEDNNKFLDGAEFEVRKEKDSTTPIKSGSTKNGGKLKFENIPIGTYWLVETKAPAGYSEIDPMEITIYPFKSATNFLTIENKIGRTIGEFDTVTKSVFNANGENIDNKLVAFDQRINYTIHSKLKNENNKTELKEVAFKDKLDKGLSKVDSTTKVIVKDTTSSIETETVLDDDKVWKKSADGKQDILDTSFYKEFMLLDNLDVRLHFEVTINHQAGKKITNEAEVKATGTKLSGGLDSRSKTTNVVTNHLGKEIYLRQVVINKNDNLALPVGNEKGFVRIENINSATQAIYSSVSLAIPSEVETKVPEFKKIFVSPTEGSKTYEIKVIAPEMYKLSGYHIKKDEALDITTVKQGTPIIDISKDEGDYITVFIEPTEKNDPNFYNWEYKLNVFNQPLTIK